jgi:hypothetical protein
MSELAAATRDALEALDLGTRPLLVVDVDEVVLRFVPHLEAFIGRQGYRLDVRSFGITGNVIRLGYCRAVPAPEVAALIAGFFAAHVGDQEPVTGAADALARLAARFDVVLLTNVPAEHVARRAARLAALGFDHPVVANDGPKGPAVAHMARALAHPLVFVDDGPINLASVRDHVPGARLVHFVDDPRYFRLAPEVPGTWLKSRIWGEVAERIGTILDRPLD